VAWSQDYKQPGILHPTTCRGLKSKLGEAEHTATIIHFIGLCDLIGG
jgi:hypothetical protein